MLTVDELNIGLSVASPQSLVWGVEGILIDKNIVYLTDKEGNILEKRNEK
jgi:hypothetical protein